MTRDLCYFYPCPLNVVYGAFVQTAAQKFGKDCKQTPMTALSFGLNFSMKYNMNGGSCTIHFIPYQNGTAINIRYSVVQLLGARYKKHAEDMLLFANQIIRANAQPANINVQEFLNYEAAHAPANQSPMAQPFQNPQTAPVQGYPPAQPAPVQPQPVPQQAYTQPVRQYSPPQQPVSGAGFCTKCGKPLPAGARFCTGCGTPVTAKSAAPSCPTCGNPLRGDENFCVRCGTQLK